MRKSVISLALAAVLGLAAVPAQAFFEANLSGGYTILNPTDLNAALATYGTATEIKSGYFVALDAGIAVFPFLKISPRVSYVGANQGGWSNSALGVDYKDTVDLNMVAGELGLTVDTGLPLTDLSIRGGVYGGMGFAALTNTYTSSAVSGKVIDLYQGSAFSGEAVVDLRYSIFPMVSLGLDAGYRFSNLGVLKDAAGNTMKDNAGKERGVDLSGINLGAVLNVGF